MLTSNESFLLMWILFTGIIVTVATLLSSYDTDDGKALVGGLVTLGMTFAGYILTICS